MRLNAVFCGIYTNRMPWFEGASAMIRAWRRHGLCMAMPWQKDDISTPCGRIQYSAMKRGRYWRILGVGLAQSHHCQLIIHQMCQSQSSLPSKITTPSWASCSPVSKARCCLWPSLLGPSQPVPLWRGESAETRAAIRW